MNDFHDVKNVFYKQEVKSAREFPNLSWRREEGVPVLSGIYHFEGIKDGIIRTGDFYLRIEFPKEYPEKLPRVFEKGGLIPYEYHHFEDESLCLGAPIELYIIFAKSPCLSTYMYELVNPYLYRWLAVNNGEESWGERSHGIEGLLESYFNLFKVEKVEQVFDLLSFVALNDNFRTNQPCACGSGLKMKLCHGKILDQIKLRVPFGLINRDFHSIEAYLLGAYMSKFLIEKMLIE